MLKLPRNLFSKPPAIAKTLKGEPPDQLGSDGCGTTDSESPLSSLESEAEQDDFEIVREVDCNVNSPCCSDLSDSLQQLKTTDAASDKKKARVKPYDRCLNHDGENQSKTVSESNSKPDTEKQTVASLEVSSDNSVLLATISTESDAKTAQKQINEYISQVLTHVQLTEAFLCRSDGEKLQKVSLIMTNTCQLHKFLMVLSHSVSCAKATCTNTCRMFRRVRHHLSKANHPCALMQVYAQLLRMHIDICLSDDCGMNNCKSLGAMRALENKPILPRQFKQLEMLISKKLPSVEVNLTSKCIENNKTVSQSVAKVEEESEANLKPKCTSESVDSCG